MEKKIITYVVGTQKNRLNETVLLSTKNICYKLWVRKYWQVDAEIFVYLNLCYPFVDQWILPPSFIQYTWDETIQSASR